MFTVAIPPLYPPPLPHPACCCSCQQMCMPQTYALHTAAVHPPIRMACHSQLPLQISRPLQAATVLKTSTLLHIHATARPSQPCLPHSCTRFKTAAPPLGGTLPSRQACTLMPSTNHAPQRTFARSMMRLWRTAPSAHQPIKTCSHTLRPCTGCTAPDPFRRTHGRRAGCWCAPQNRAWVALQQPVCPHQPMRARKWR